MMENPFILLWMEAPLQSWGADSRFGRRETLPFPTKSGVLGLVLAALGARGEQRELLAEFAPLRQTAVSYRSVNRDSEPPLRDFHMVGSGYDDSDNWATFMIPKTAEGKKAVGGGTKITYRFYLQDARFAVILEVPEARSQSLAAALENPVYDLFLGRKCCVPTDFVFRGLFENSEDALEAADEIARSKGLEKAFLVVDRDAEGESLNLNDVPIQFGDRKLYRDRRVTVVV